MNKICRLVTKNVIFSCHRMMMNIRSILYKRKIINIATSNGKDADGDLVYFKKRKYFVHLMLNYVQEVE